MFTLIAGSILLVVSILVSIFFKSEVVFRIGGKVSALVSVVWLATSFITTVPAGHNKVPTLFGKVGSAPINEGLNFVNPMLQFVEFDLRQKTHLEQVGIPAEDKLITKMDVSVQYRTVGGMTPEILKNTGSTDALIQVHLVPKLRSILREQGKGVKTSQDFFKDEVQKRLQITLRDGLVSYLSPKGISVEAVLIRKVKLPKVIRDSITETKKREQEVLKQGAELERFAKEQEQKVKTAEAELAAAKLEAQQIKTLADAEAYKIEAINRMLAKSPNYIELRKVEQWSGVLPLYTGGENIPMIDLRK